MAAVRAFAAIELCGEAKRELERFAAGLSETGAEVRWTPRDNMHLTLKFFGHVPRPVLDALCLRIEAAAAAMRPFDLALGAPGFFPDARRPQIVWVGASSGEREAALAAEAADGAAEAEGIPREPRAFRAHVTIGRVKGSRGAKGLAEAASRLAPPAPSPTRVDSIAVFESKLTSDGAVYEIYRRCPFARA